MITKEDAMMLQHRVVLYHNTAKNKDGTDMRCRVNGKCKTWKTRPDEFSLPVASGLYEHGYIDQTNCMNWRTEL